MKSKTIKKAMTRFIDGVVTDNPRAVPVAGACAVLVRTISSIVTLTAISADIMEKGINVAVDPMISPIECPDKTFLVLADLLEGVPSTTNTVEPSEATIRAFCCSNASTIGITSSAPIVDCTKEGFFHN